MILINDFPKVNCVRLTLHYVINVKLISKKNIFMFISFREIIKLKFCY